MNKTNITCGYSLWRALGAAGGCPGGFSLRAIRERIDLKKTGVSPSPEAVLRLSFDLSIFRSFDLSIFRSFHLFMEGEAGVKKKRRIKETM